MIRVVALIDILKSAIIHNMHILRSEDGFIQVVLIGISILLMLVTINIFSVIKTNNRIFKKNFDALKFIFATNAIISQINFEVVGTDNIIAYDLDIYKNKVYEFEDIEYTVEEVVDESAKLNINTQSYALPYVLKEIFPEMPSWTRNSLITELGHALNYKEGMTREKVKYYYIPNVEVSYTISDIPPDVGGGTNTLNHRVYAPVVLPTDLSKYGQLESIDELANFTSWKSYFGDNITQLNKWFTVAPSVIGLNVNTASREVLQGIINWQNSASLMMQDFSYVYQNKVSSEINTITHARFRYNKVSSADDVIPYRPYKRYEIAQTLLFFPIRSIIGNNSGFSGGGEEMTDVIKGPSVWANPFSNFYVAADFVVEGPGPYTTTTSVYTITISKGSYKMTIQEKLSKELLPSIMEYKIEIQ